MRILCLDIEGGYGGSSRSLYESARHLHKDVELEVWCRRSGPVQDRYKALGISCRVMPDMPHISSLPRLSRNLYAFGRYALHWQANGSFRRDLLLAARDRFDVVHFNHEGLFLLLRSLRSSVGPQKAMTLHVRTHLQSTMFSRWQYRTIAHAADGAAFITENERDRSIELAGRTIPGSVIYNIVTPPKSRVPADSALAGDNRFKVAVLSNFALERGTDRIVDVARALASAGRRDVLFVVAGNMDLKGSLPGALGRVARAGGNLETYAHELGLGDMFHFTGHVADPEPLLTACDVLAKPTREYNPWGRDILEAMAYAKPPISVGTYNRFVENGVTGVLHPEFDAGQWASDLAALADDRKRCKMLGTAAAKRVASLCNGLDRAQDLLKLWQSAYDKVQDKCAA